MADFPQGQRGFPPSRPFPSQLMHLLELTRLDQNAAAKILHVATGSIDRWMIFNTKDTMPPTQWLLLNLYTLAVKGVCWPEGLEKYIRDRFHGAFDETIKPWRNAVVPESPPLAGADEILAILDAADATLEEVVFAQKSMISSWLGADKRPIPYAVYELTVMTLWARGQYAPSPEIADYIHKKYNGAFKPGR